MSDKELLINVKGIIDRIKSLELRLAELRETKEVKEFIDLFEARIQNIMFLENPDYQKYFFTSDLPSLKGDKVLTLKQAKHKMDRLEKIKNTERDKELDEIAQKYFGSPRK